jgi:hypothetical protein
MVYVTQFHGSLYADKHWASNSLFLHEKVSLTIYSQITVIINIITCDIRAYKGNQQVSAVYLLKSTK